MSRFKALAIVGFAFLLFAPDAKADATACSDAYTRAQELRAKRKLLGAREALRVCAQQSCPGFIVKDCVTWLDEVQSSLPSVVPVGTDAAGNDLAGVRVAMDGEVLFESSDGRSVEVNPGMHTFTFELRGPGGRDEAPPVVKRLVVAEGEKNKRIAALVQKPGPAPALVAPVPAQQVQVQQVQVQPALPPQPQRRVVPVTVEGNRDDLRLQFDSFETNTHTSCNAPCTADLPVGNYQVGIARGTGAIRSSQFVYVGAPGTVKATSTSRTGLHVGGVLLLIGSVFVQIGLSADAVSHNECIDDGVDGPVCTNSTNTNELVAATTIGILGFTAGIIMIAQKSRSDVTFVPLNVGSITTSHDAAALRFGATAPQGGAIQVRF